MTSAVASEPRRIGGPLMLGIFFLPHVFVWFLLRRGYSAGSRWAGFSYLAVNLLFAAVRIYTTRR